MRTLGLLLVLTVSAAAQDVTVAVRPNVIYVETIGGNIGPSERVFFHIIVENTSPIPVDIEWVRFDVISGDGIAFSGQYSGQALIDLFDSAIERKRIEPTPGHTLTLQSGNRKAISDILLETPAGLIGDTLLVEAAYKSQGKADSSRVSTPLDRTPGFSGRLPVEGIWYVAAEHGFLDPHKRFLAEAFAYDFLQIGSNGKSFGREGRNNPDYWAYNKKVLASKEGTVVFLRDDVGDNIPGETANTETPGGNIVVIDHGSGQFGYYAHLKPSSVTVKVGDRVQAGDPIAAVGNSGDSREPHLHFHVMNGPDSSEADGIPAGFKDWRAQSHTQFPSLKQGVLPRGEFVQP